MPNPEIFVIAGPNGAGKSTGAATILPTRFPSDRFLNADDIAKALATDSRIAAGKIMLRRMRELRDQHVSFAFETTLAGQSHARFLQEAKKAGYRVYLAYVWLSSVELARKRVAARVQDGGHDVPAADIERRYRRGLKNLFTLYFPLADRWILCDNSVKKLVVVARGRIGEKPGIHDPQRFKRIRDAAGQD
jgi:predicted ABC-type ATPase